MQDSSEPGRPFPTAALFAALAVLMTCMASPSVGWRDAGELGSAAFQLGIAHPTGFPLVLLVSHALAALLPLGDAAFRLNMASALAMAGAATLAARLAHASVPRRGQAGPVAGCLVVIGFLMSPTLSWFGAAMEAYATAALLVSAAMWAALKARQDGRFALMSFLLLGLSAGCHVSAVMGSGCAALAALVAAGRPRPRVLAMGAAATLAGALVIAYLPVRSAAGPTVSWDDLTAPGALWHHLSGMRIREAFADRTTSMWDVMSLGRLLTEDLGLGAFVLAPCGLALSKRRTRCVAVGLALAALLSVGYSLLVNPMGIVDRQVGFLATVSGLTLAGIAGGEIVARIPRLHLVVAGALALAFLARPAGTCKVTQDDLPLLWASTRLGGLPPRALVLCTSDEMCGLGLWLQRVEGTRPDVAVVPRQHVWHDGTLRQSLAASHPTVAVGVAGRGPGMRERLQHLVRMHSGMPVYWEVGDGSDLPLAFGPMAPPLDWGPGATPPLARIGKAAIPPPATLASLAERFLAHIELAGHDTRDMRPCDLSFVARRMLARDFLAVGLVTAWRGNRPGSMEAFERSLLVKPDYAPALVNLAILRAETGDLEAGIALARRALEAEPDRVKARVTLGRLLMAAGREAEALEVLGPVEGGSR
jgi:hypothetical protein